MAHTLHPGGQQLWHEICQQRQCQPFDKMPQEKVRTHQRLGQQPLLWHQAELELQQPYSGYFITGYIIKQLQKYKHAIPAKPQHCRYTPQPCQCGSNAQCLLPLDTSPHLLYAHIKHIQWFIGGILCYARALDLTVMMALSTIASEQAHSTKNRMQKTKQILDYLATHSDATVQFHASDMI
jgi:hypothetical protein